MKIKLTKVKSFLKKLPKVLARKPFLVLFGLIFLALIFGAFVFYQFCFLPERKEISLEEEDLKFEEELCQEFLKNLEEREKRFQQTESKIYPNPFRFKREELTE